MFDDLKQKVVGLKLSATTKIGLAVMIAMVTLSGLVSAANASYTPVYTPVPIATPVGNVPDLIAIVMDVSQGVLNLAASNFITLMMFVLCIVLIIMGAIFSLFRRGRKRGR